MLRGTGAPVEVQVVQEREVILTELFQDEAIAQQWANAYQERLREQGWYDSPA